MAISKGTQYITDPDSIPVNTSTGQQEVSEALDSRVSAIYVQGDGYTALRAAFDEADSLNLPVDLKGNTYTFDPADSPDGYLNLPENGFIGSEGHITGGACRWLRKKYIQCGPVRLEDLLLSGVWYSKFEKLWVTNTLKIDGGGSSWGTFWNKFDHVIADILNLNTDNHSVNQNRFDSVRGALLIDGGFSGNPLPQECDNNSFDSLDSTNGNLTDSGGTSGWQVLNDSFLNQRNTIREWYSEGAGNLGIKGNWHVEGQYVDSNAAPYSLTPRNHVLFSSTNANRAKVDFFAGNPKSNWAEGGLWDYLNLDDLGQPICMTSSLGGSAIEVTADPNEPTGIGHRYTLTTDVGFANLRVNLGNNLSGVFGCWLWLYAPDDHGNIVFVRSSDEFALATSVSAFYDAGNGWRLLWLSGDSDASLNEAELRIYLNGGSGGPVRSVGIGAIWASPEQTCFYPSRVPDNLVSGRASSEPSGSFPQLPDGAFVENRGSTLNISGWRHTASGSFEPVPTKISGTVSSSYVNSVTAGVATTMFTLTTPGFRGAAGGVLKISVFSAGSSPSFQEATGYSEHAFSLVKESSTYNSDIQISGEAWYGGASSPPTVSINRTGNDWELQITLPSGIDSGEVSAEIEYRAGLGTVTLS